MTKIESKKCTVNAKPAEVFSFLSDMNNIEKLLPEGKYSDWKSDSTSCSFKVQGAYNIGLILGDTVPNSSIVYDSAEGAPFSFTLKVALHDSGSGTEGQLICNAKINPFLEILVKNPLKNLFDYMSEQLSVQFP